MEDYEKFAKRMEEQYPKMFVTPYGGFAVGDGWYPVLEKLCANIQQHIDWANRNGEVVPQVVVEQIKEKFGGLRFYYQGGDEQIHGMVRMAEAWAGDVCEKCGAPGERGGNGWIRTLCPTHRAETEAARVEYMKANGLEE